jgi:MFS family permease
VAFALLMSGGALGPILLPAVAQLLIGSVSWRGAFAILGLSVLLIGLPLASRVKRRTAVQIQPETSQVTLGQGLRSWIFWVILIVLFAASLSQNGAIAHLAPLLTDRGVNFGSAALAVSVLGGRST